MLHIRTSDQIIRTMHRKLAADRDNGSAGLTAINTSDPNTLNTNRPSPKDAHGISGSQCMVSLAIGALGASSVTITVWLWDKTVGFWLKLGADSTQYSKSFDAKSVDGFGIPEKQYFYLQGSDNVDDAWVDAQKTNFQQQADGTTD